MSNPTSTPENEEFGVTYARKQIERRASLVRRLIRRRYVSNILRFVVGPTVDVGCGAGQILERLPSGSTGLEVNRALVGHFIGSGLDVRSARVYPDRIDLEALAPNRYRTLILSHVLEHFEGAHRVLDRLLCDAGCLGIERVVVVVPGLVGFRSDSTHKSFVTLGSLREHRLLQRHDFAMGEYSYFPGNLEALGRIFVYHELIVVFDRTPGAIAPVEAEGTGPDVANGPYASPTSAG